MSQVSEGINFDTVKRLLIESKRCGWNEGRDAAQRAIVSTAVSLPDGVTARPGQIYDAIMKLPNPYGE